jgi:MFS family permease
MRIAGGTGLARWWAAQGISNLGEGVYGTAPPLLAATLTRDPLLVSLVSSAEWLAWLLFGLVLGGSAVCGVLGSLVAGRVVRVVGTARITIWTVVGSALGFLVFDTRTVAEARAAAGLEPGP